MHGRIDESVPSWGSSPSKQKLNVNRYLLGTLLDHFGSFGLSRTYVRARFTSVMGR
jgi:hypothetical protein